MTAVNIPPKKWLVVIVLAIALTTVYASTLLMLMERWNNTDYVHGFLVIPFAIVILYVRREMMPTTSMSGSWWGLPIVVVALAMRSFGAFASDPIVDPISFVVTVFGVALFLGGWSVIRWAWPAIVFLFFMIPLPSFLGSMWGLTLQRIGTVVSTYIIQTIGLQAHADGNTITLRTAQLGVVEACSGIRMLALFFAVCVGAVFVMRLSLLEKCLIVASAPPIAIASNVIRITVTAMMYEWTTPDLAEKVFHDLAGYFMMPLAVGMLALEIWLLRKIVPEHDTTSEEFVSSLSGPPL
jgi:exosortase